VQDFDDADSEVMVKFYDGVTSRVSLSEVFPIPREKHAADKRNILCREIELVGQVVVAWNDNRRIFELGTVYLFIYLLGPFYGTIAVPLSRVVVVVVVVVDIDFTLPFTRCRYCHTSPALYL